MKHQSARSRGGRSLAAAAGVAALLATAGVGATVGPAAAQGKPAPSLTPQVIAFPSRTFVSVAEPDQTDATTTWTHNDPLAPFTETSRATAVAPSAAELGVIDINHAGPPCWTPALSPSARMSPGDSVTVRAGVTSPATARNLDLTVADVTTVQAKAGAAGTVVVHGSASDPATGGQVAAGNLQVRLVAKKQAFTLNGRRDLRAVLGGGKDGVLNYDTATSKTFTATFDLTKGRNLGQTSTVIDADVARAVAAQTRGIVQNDPADPTAITIYETPQPGDGVVPGPAAGC